MTRAKQSQYPVEAATAGEAGSEPRPVATLKGGHNCVSLSGRVSGVPQRRVLPSGDAVVQLRVVVPRDPPLGRAVRSPRSALGTGGRAGGRRAASVDTIDVGVWGKVLQRRALKLADGAEVVVRGALRRRFWRGPAGPVSRYEVEASAIEVGDGADHVRSGTTGAGSAQ